MSFGPEYMAVRRRLLKKLGWLSAPNYDNYDLEMECAKRGLINLENDEQLIPM